MPYAQTAANYINAYCCMEFPKEHRAGIASTLANGGAIDAFDHVGHGTHKYLPAERLTAELGEPQGAGVYGYWKMADGSYLLLTCRGPLAWWSGQDGDPAQWGKFHNA